MRTGHRPAWRRRPQSRAARIAVPLAIPMALGLTLGAVLAFTGGPSSTTIKQAAAGATASPSASASASAAASAAASPAATAAAPAAAAANVSCDIVVPANPLTAQGLATPFQLTGPNGMTPAQSGCTMANFANLGAFVQATILNPATGALSVYEPLVITQGTTAAVAPVVPTLPQGAVVTIDFGFNGTNLTQVGATRNALRQGNCVNGLNGSIFGQVSFCNGTQFFQAAFQAEQQGKLTIPALGTTATTGQPCLSTRSFDMIDQDQSDNVTTTYLLTANGQTAQFNAANKAAMAGAQPINNGSDNMLLDGVHRPDHRVHAIRGAGPVPGRRDGHLAGPGRAVRGQEPGGPRSPWCRRTTRWSWSTTPSARPRPTSTAATSASRPSATPTTRRTARRTTARTWSTSRPRSWPTTRRCSHAATPVPGTGNNLLTFMANRLNMSFTNLNCQNFGLKNPVTVTLDGNGAAIAATFNTAQQTATAAAPAAPANPRQRNGGPRHRFQAPSGM